MAILSYPKCQFIMFLLSRLPSFASKLQNRLCKSLLSCVLRLKNTLLLNKYHQVHEDVNLHICVYAETQFPHLTISKLSNLLSIGSIIFGWDFKMPLNHSTTGLAGITQSHYNLLARVKPQLFLNKIIKLVNSEVSFGWQ